MFTILGYTDQISVAPGETLTARISAERDQRYTARVVRVVNGDCNPAGPGFHVVPVPTAIDGEYAGRRQRTDAGSYMVARDLPPLAPGIELTLTVWPTLLNWPERQVVAHLASSAGALVLAFEARALLLEWVASGGTQRLALPAGGLAEREWARITVTAGAAGLSLRAEPLRRFPLIRTPLLATAALDGALPDGLTTLYLAGAPQPDGTVGAHYNGKVEAPTLSRPGGPADTHRIAAWDFAREMQGTRAVDAGPFAHHAELMNMPARAMAGSAWDGGEHDWRRRPSDYAAIHFHHDDLYDAGWEAAFSLRIPEDFRSGAYALHVRDGDNTEFETHEDYIPFFVRPPREPARRSGRPRLLFLAPTNSYVAYANDSQVLTDRGAETGMGRLLVLQHADLHLHAHPELCASLYDRHADGSGVCYSSRLRPVLNMRPRYHSWLGSHGSALYQYNGDTHILAWLEHEGVAFDVATDEDLHRDGLGLLDHYDTVVTGTHPEYHSTAMWDAMQAWLGRGGRLMYMGGNGWYWRVAFHATLPGVIEVRRAESGTRTWEAAPGEAHQSFDGELGGLWRRIGRPPNLLAGVGFVAQGFDMSGHFRRADGSRDPRAAFVFAGVDDEVIGDFGLVGGGAAGVELDAYNTLLGSPPHALVLATSENHTQMTVLTPEEFLVNPVTSAGDQNERVRADMVFFETSSGGAVFSTGSIAWSGSLPWNGFDNSVRRITANVLHRFLDPTPFVPPDRA